MQTVEIPMSHEDRLRQQATRFVVKQARDDEDARLLLECLGLDEPS